MKKRSAFIALMIAALLCVSIALVACDSFKNPGDSLGGGGIGVLPDEMDSITTDEIEISDFSELEGNTSLDGITVSGSSEKYTISESGTYVLSGSFSAGIEVSVADKQTTRLVLNGAAISNDNGIALSNTNKKSSLIITLAEGTQNTISNAGEDSNAIHVKGTLGINGKGSLSVISDSKSALKVSKGFSMIDANVTLSAKNHGLTAAFVEIHSATLNVTAAGKDGINAESGATEFGYDDGFVILKDAAYTCSVSGDGIQADTYAYIDGGNVSITTNGTFVKYNDIDLDEYGLEADDFRYVYNNGDYKKVASDERVSLSRTYALTQSCKGIKVGEIKYTDDSDNEIVVTDGDYLIVVTGSCVMDINSTDDAIHTNSGNVLIKSGTITINTYDDGITSDVLTQIDGGIIDIQKSYEGIEGAYVAINGGEIYIVSTDDGINAASDDNAIKEYITVSDGIIRIDASGDGIDSNGSILITGGDVLVYGPTTGGDAALDADSGIIIQGGKVWASSTLGMVETPSTNSTQYVVSYAQKSELSKGSEFCVKDSSGNVLYSVEVGKACQSIIFSIPELENGKEYTIYCNDVKMESFTISDTITTIGTAQNAGPGGGGGMNGPWRPNGGRP